MNNNQRDYVFNVGFAQQPCYYVGCTISAIGDILGKTPLEINETLKTNGGFSDGTPNGIGKGNLVVWKALEKAFPGTKVTRVYGYNNAEVLANCPNVVVEVPATPIGGRGSHWVNYLGNHLLKDPWTGKIRPTSDFPNPTGYTIIIPPKVAKTDPQKLAEITAILYSNENSDTKIENAKRVIA